jgi:putative transposase
MESFFSTLTTKCGNWPFVTRAQARIVFFEHMEDWYNRRRLRSFPGFLTPAEFEE